MIDAEELRRRVRRGAKRVRVRTARWLEEPSAASTHQLRTALRRLRVAFALLPGAVRKRRRARRFVREARALFQACSALRDADVMRGRAAVLPPALGAALIARVEADRAAWEDRARRRARKLLATKVPALRAAALEGAAVARRAVKVVGELGRTVRRQLPAALRVDEPPETLHGVRKACKSLRYAYELVAPEPVPPPPPTLDPRQLAMQPSAPRSPIDWSRALQDALGELHDLDVIVALLEALEPVADRLEVLEMARAQRASKLEELAVFVRRTPELLPTIAPVA